MRYTSFPMLLWVRIVVISSGTIKLRLPDSDIYHFYGTRTCCYVCRPGSYGCGLGLQNYSQGEGIMIGRVFGHSKGQSLMEYALLFVLIAVVVIAILVYLGPQLASQYKIISNAL